MHTHQKLHSEVITLSPRRPLTPQTRHKHIRDHRRPPDTRVWKRQPGSILCLAWEQLSAASWDHKSSLSTGHASSCGGMLNAGRRPELGGMPRVAGKKNKKGKKKRSSICSLKSRIVLQHQINLFLHSCPDVCDRTTDHLGAPGIKTDWTCQWRMNKNIVTYGRRSSVKFVAA